MTGKSIALLSLTFFCLSSGAVAGQHDYHPLEAHLSESYNDDLPDLMKRGRIRVLTTINRTNFFLVCGEPHGFEYSLLKEYETYLKETMGQEGQKVNLEFVPVARDELLPGLVRGDGDIAAAGLTITDQRKKTVDFSIPYITGIDEVLVTNVSVATPVRVEDLAGKRIFVRYSSSYYDSLVALNKHLEKRGRKPVSIVEADEDLETEDILELVNSGAMRRTICDSHIARFWQDILENISVHEDVRIRRGGKIAWAVRRDNPQLKKSINGFMKEHRKGTLLGNIYFTRYYEEKRWIRNPMTEKTKAACFRYRPLIEKYADRYGFDWRLIMAIAYQESRLDHSRISKEGAVGLMQVRPSTAADPHVDIEYVGSLENNIHAAVKYLAFLRNRYYSSAGIQPRDRTRFTLAAYNAGPAAVRKARRKAAAMNLDPDRWFHNVEVSMYEIVGDETVRYVRNINKYYIVYKNAMARIEERKNAMEGFDSINP